MGPEGKMSTGMLGRGMATSAGIYEAGKGLLGMDFSPALMFSAMPNPSFEGAPFYPFPLVPPAVGIAGSIYGGLHSGNYSQAVSNSAMLLPGGVGMRRAWKNWAPKYADYKNRQPDGKIPIYNDKGNLVGSYSPVQMVMKGLGLSPADTQKELEMTNYLVKQRDNIRNYRRLFLDELGRNNLEAAGKINREFQKEYPGVGPIQVKKSDIKAMEGRRETSRLNRIVKGIPNEYKPIFQRVIAEADLQDVAQNIESDPGSLGNYIGYQEPSLD
jgi:hypothetical protein